MPSGLDLNFSLDEYAQRLRQTQAAMAAQGITLLITVDPSNMAWLTGYDGWSFYTHQCVLVRIDAEPIWFGRGIDRPGALRTCYLKEENLIGYPDYYVQSTTHHPMEFLATTIVELGLDGSQIGVEMDNYYFTAAAFAALQTGLASSHFIDANGLINWQRAIKSKQELKYIKRAARIVEKMHQCI